MKNITGPPVIGENFLATRLPQVDNLRNNLMDSSCVIDAPRRFGKTSIIKELMRQEEKNKNFKVLFLDLEGELSVSDFCERLVFELTKLYILRNADIN